MQSVIDMIMPGVQGVKTAFLDSNRVILRDPNSLSVQAFSYSVPVEGTNRYGDNSLQFSAFICGGQKDKECHWKVYLTINFQESELRTKNAKWILASKLLANQV